MMIYAIWTHAFHLSGAEPNQFSVETFTDKKNLIDTVIDWFEGNREPIINLGSDDAEDSLDEALSELHSLLEDPDLDNTDLSDMNWTVEDAEITIHMAEEYPAVLECFQDVMLEVAEDAFSEYVDAEYEDDEDFGDDEDDEDDGDFEYEDDGFLRLYREICSVDQSTTPEEFDRIFDACGSLGEWGAF